jgi:hypothetical protein
MMLATKHDEVKVAISCALQDNLGYVMLGRAQHFAVRVRRHQPLPAGIRRALSVA